MTDRCRPPTSSANASSGSRIRASSPVPATTSTTSSSPSMAHMAILRSPYAHANIRSIDTSAAKAMPGVVARLRRRRHPVQPDADGLAGRRQRRASRTTSARPGRSPRTASSGPARASPRSSPRRRRRRSTRSTRSSSTGSRCPRSSMPRRRSQPGAPQLHENAPNNVVFEWSVGDKAGTDAAVDGAEVVVRQRIVNQRLIPNPMEVRGDIGWYNPGTDEYTIWMSSQTPHIQRLLLAAFVMGIPEHKIRCISPDVGGAFGTKIFCYPDYALVLFASKALGGRPVKWIETPPRELPEHDPRPRPHHLPRDRRHARGRDHRPPGQDAGQPRRPPVDDRPGHPDDAVRPRPARLLQDPERLRRGDRRLHEHDVRGRLPRRRPARRRPTSSSGRWTCSPPRSGWTARSSGAGTSSSPTSSRTRTRPASGTASGGAKIYIDSGNYEPALDKALDDGRLRRAGERPRPRPRPAASSSASACRPTSRSAASRRRSGSAPSAKAGAPRCGSRPTSRST